MEISDLKSAAKLLPRYYTIKDCEDFQVTYCALMWLKGMQNCRQEVKVGGPKKLPYTCEARLFHYITRQKAICPKCD